MLMCSNCTRRFELGSWNVKLQDLYVFLYSMLQFVFKFNILFFVTRNYHVFYYLLAGASEEERSAFHLKQPEEYHYLNQVGLLYWWHWQYLAFSTTDKHPCVQ